MNEGDGLETHLLPGLGAQGVPKGLSGTTVPLNYNSFEDLEKLNDEEIGVLKMEVVRTKEPKEGFLEKIREICTEKGIVLIFDECTSGFRETNGGIHKKYGVEPDMAIFGKAIGNGYAITSVIGRGRIMNAMLDTFVSSTFWTERLGTRAAIATLKEIERQKLEENTYYRPKNQKDMGKYGQETELKVVTEGINGLPTFRFLEICVRYEDRLYRRMLDYGILATTQLNPTTQHREQHIKKYEIAVKEIFEEIKNIELSGDLTKLCKGKVCKASFKRLN